MAQMSRRGFDAGRLKRVRVWGLKGVRVQCFRV